MTDIPDRGSGHYKDGKPVRGENTWQDVKNESWPQRDPKGPHARDIHDQPADNQRPVWVRVVFKDDGEVTLPGRASRWNASHVYVIVNDPRVRLGIWVRAADVRRRDQ